MSLISHPDVYVLRSSSLLREGRGVSNDGPEIFPVLSGWVSVLFCSAAAWPCIPRVILHIAFSPREAEGELQTQGMLQSDTGHLYSAKHTVSTQ